MTKYIVTVDSYGSRFWHNESNQLHRTDGPAVEHADDSKQWWLNGKRHRTDGPAVVYADGDMEWWLNGELHRTDGPAVEYADDDKFWYLEGKQLTEAEFLKRTRVKAPCADKVVEIDGVKYRLVRA